MICLLRVTLLLSLFVVLVTSFTTTSPPSRNIIIQSNRLASTAVAAEEDASAMTEFMARAHEEKLRALDRAEAKYQDRIAELEAQVEELQGPNTGSEATSSNSYAFPATNKLLSEKVAAYRELLSNYFVKSQDEKMKAVQDAEQKQAAKYEAIIAELKKESP